MVSIARRSIMKKKSVIILALAFCASLLFAQASVNPSDDFYVQLDRWQTMGLIPQQVQLRPYPVHVIQQILERVSEGGNETEAAVAADLYERIFYRKIQGKLNPVGTIKSSRDTETGLSTTSGQLTLEPALIGDLTVLDDISIGYNIAALIGNDLQGSYLPAFQAYPYYLHDMADFKSINNSLETDASFAWYGKKNLYFQMGIGHASIGPFLGDNILFSEKAPHTANFALVYNSDFIQFVDSMFILSATSAKSSWMYPGKFLMMQTLNVNLLSWLSVGFVNYSIFGNRFDPAYFVPVPFIVTEGVTGYDNDNVLMGGSFSVRPIPGLVWNGLFILDDIGFTELKTYRSIKLKSAFQTEIGYVPAGFSWLQKVSAGYTFVTPWMYAHIVNSGTGSLSEVNYQNYMTSGRPLATSLPPNSDRISLSADFKPTGNLKIGVTGTVIRHANVNEGLPIEEQLAYMKGEYLLTDSSIENHQFNYWNGGSSGFNPLTSSQHRIMLLTQPTKEYTYQLGLDTEYVFPRKSFGQFTVGAGYTFEYIKNHGVSTDIFPGGNAAATEADVVSAIEAWRNTLTDLRNHYFTLYIRYLL